MARTGRSRREVEDLLRANGFPLSVASEVRRRGLFVRSVPILGGLVVASAEIMLLVAGGGLSDDLYERRHMLYLVVNVALVAAPFVVAWALHVLLGLIDGARRRSSAKVLLGLAVVVVPGVTAAVLAGSSSGWAVAAAVSGVALYPLARALAYVGAGSIVSWSARQAFRQIKSLWSFVGQMLPVLVIAVLFFLCSPDAWQLAAGQSRGRMWLAVAALGALCLVVIIISANDNLKKAELGDSAARVVPLRRAEKVTAISLVTIAQVIQMALVAALTFLFFLGIGLVMVPRKMMTLWVCAGDPGCSYAGDGIWDVQRQELIDGELFQLTLPGGVPQVLVQLCVIIAAISIISFVGSITLESEHHNAFYAPILRLVSDAITMRDDYLATYCPPRPRPE